MSRLTRQRGNHGFDFFRADSTHDATVSPRSAQSTVVRPRARHGSLSRAQGHAALVRSLGLGPKKRSVAIWHVLSRLFSRDADRRASVRLGR